MNIIILEYRIGNDGYQVPGTDPFFMDRDFPIPILHSLNDLLAIPILACIPNPAHHCIFYIMIYKRCFL